jgi:hypothetical protein
MWMFNKEWDVGRAAVMVGIHRASPIGIVVNWGEYLR